MSRSEEFCVSAHTHQDAMQLEHQWRRNLKLSAVVAIVEPLQRLDVVDQLDLRRRRGVELTCRRTFSLDQRKLIALNQRRVMHCVRQRRRASGRPQEG